MTETKEIISKLRKFKLESSVKYGIKHIGIFGSYARGQQTEDSDVDVFISLNESDFFTVERIREELETLLHHSIDLVNFRESLRNTLKQNILKDAVSV